MANAPARLPMHGARFRTASGTRRLHGPFHSRPGAQSSGVLARRYSVSAAPPSPTRRSRLTGAPKLANPRHKPPDPGAMAEAMRAVESAKVESAKEVSRPDS
jgi:hypothetical protein